MLLEARTSTVSGDHETRELAPLRSSLTPSGFIAFLFSFDEGDMFFALFGPSFFFHCFILSFLTVLTRRCGCSSVVTTVVRQHR